MVKRSAIGSVMHNGLHHLLQLRQRGPGDPDSARKGLWLGHLEVVFATMILLRNMLIVNYRVTSVNLLL